MDILPGHGKEADHRSRHSVLVWGCYEVSYEMIQPDPSHWAAVGVVTDLAIAPSVTTPALIVGTGSCEEEAICDLRSRVMNLYPLPQGTHDIFAVEWAFTGD